MNTSYTPIRPLMRCLLAASAATATLLCAAAIDGLAYLYPSQAAAEQAAKATSITVASKDPR